MSVIVVQNILLKIFLMELAKFSVKILRETANGTIVSETGHKNIIHNKNRTEQFVTPRPNTHSIY